MRPNTRREPRNPSRKACSLLWSDGNGSTRSQEVQVVSRSRSGLAARTSFEVQPGTKVYVQTQDGEIQGEALVRHCTLDGSHFILGLELELPKDKQDPTGESAVNYYEFLQISPNAEFATIQRIYRFLAARFHPDNPDTGDPDRFVLLNHAYAILSDPKSRAEYDAQMRADVFQPAPMATSVDFMDDLEGEVNRRMAILSVLYNKRRTNSDYPLVSLGELEMRMGFPREYLDFATWYLKSKKYITREDNSDFSITAAGVDYVEENRANVPVLRTLLLNSGSAPRPGGRREATADRSSDAFIRGPESTTGNGPVKG